MEAKRVRLTKDVGTAKRGEIYIRGLYEPTEHWKNQGYNQDDFYWEEGSAREEYGFLPASSLWGVDDNGEEFSYAEEIK